MVWINVQPIEGEELKEQLHTIQAMVDSHRQGIGGCFRAMLWYSLPNGIVTKALATAGLGMCTVSQMFFKVCSPQCQ